MVKEIFSNEEYAFIAVDIGADGKFEQRSLADAFYRVAAKHGIQLNPNTSGRVSIFSPAKNVPFKDMQAIIDEVSSRSETSVFISLATDFNGEQVYYAEDPIRAVQAERILAAIHRKHQI